MLGFENAPFSSGIPHLSMFLCILLTILCPPFSQAHFYSPR